jgi:hypothetical protein
MMYILAYHLHELEVAEQGHHSQVKSENRLPLGGKAVFTLECALIINLLRQLIPAFY